MLTVLPPRLIAPLLAIMLLLPRTGEALMAGARPDSPAQRIDAPTAESRWSGVVAIRVGGGTFSGVLVADRYVLTAAHVAAAAVAKPAELQIVFNLPGGATNMPAARIELFPSFNFPYDDLALIHLASDAPDAAQRYAVQDGMPIPGASLITLVGYGASGNGDSGPATGSDEHTRRVGENVIDTLTDRIDTSGRTSSFYVYDFDGPSGNGLMGGATLGNTRETMVAPGDSGSPAFVDSAERNVVIGINTFASPLRKGTAITYTFGQGGGGMRLSDPRFIAWLRKTSENDIRLASEPVSERWLSPMAMTAGGSIAGTGVFALIFLVRHRRRKAVRG